MHTHAHHTDQFFFLFIVSFIHSLRMTSSFWSIRLLFFSLDDRCVASYASAAKRNPPANSLSSRFSLPFPSVLFLLRLSLCLLPYRATVSGQTIILHEYIHTHTHIHILTPLSRSPSFGLQPCLCTKDDIRTRSAFSHLHVTWPIYLNTFTTPQHTQIGTPSAFI